MKRILLTLGLVLAAIATPAQSGKFGYIDYEETMKLMPQYAEAAKTLDIIQKEYAKEAERTDMEFYRQYMEFLHVQNNVSQTILLKRQKELQNLYDNGMRFKKAMQDSVMAERERLLKPIKSELSQHIYNVGKELNLDYVIDLSSAGYLFINSTNSIDITEQVCKAFATKQEE